MVGRTAGAGLGGAGNGTRTRDIQLGKLALYQLSYARTQVQLKQPRTEFTVPQGCKNGQPGLCVALTTGLLASGHRSSKRSHNSLEVEYVDLSSPEVEERWKTIRW